MAVSATDAADYRALLGEVNRLAQEDLVSLWRALEHLDKEQLWASLKAGVPEIVALYRSMAADTAMVFYEETQDLTFSTTDGLQAARVPEKQLVENMRWAVFDPGATEVLGLVAGMVQKYVTDGARDYALAGFGGEGEHWVRDARPGACEFCRMLATRSVTNWGPYRSARGAVKVGSGRARPRGNQPTGKEFHQHCMCIPVKRSHYEPPAYVDKWTEEYYLAVGKVGNSFDTKAILSAMRSMR